MGERVWTPNQPAMTSGFEKPDLTVIDLDLTGVMYTVSLAVQQFRRQEPKNGFRGKIGCVASICGFYCVPTLPIYTAAKHGVNGFVRSFGKYLPEEQITMNAVVSLKSLSSLFETESHHICSHLTSSEQIFLRQRSTINWKRRTC